MRKPKIKKDEKKSEAPKAGHNIIDPEQQKLFLAHKALYKGLSEKLKKVQEDFKEVRKTIKEDGFTVAQIKLAIQLETPEGEDVLRMSIANDLLVAQWMAADVGEQLALFLEPSRIPASDRAFSEGVRDANENRAARPNYSPDSEQAQKYLEGYHSTQEKQVFAGIKKLDAMAEMVDEDDFEDADHDPVGDDED